jgi:uncharacterized membrane protein YgdD (TMEM256/DUF423 family)
MITSVASAQGHIAPRIGTLAACAFVLGAALFAGDVTLRTYAGTRLFPMAAPTGGTILIISWLILSVAALTATTSRG